jgi:Domain of unknown function (DUF1735)
MKMINNLIKATLVLSVIGVFNACTKVDTPQPLGDKGQTIVKTMFDQADDNGRLYRIVNIGLVSTPQDIEMIDVRRDIPNETELGKTMKVIIKDAPGAVSDYNAANGKSYIPLPPGSFTVDAANPRVGTDYTMTFGPGEFAKWLKIKLLDALSLDLTKTYAMGFTITSADNNGHIAAKQNTIVVEVGVKNQWDGIYKITGDFTHPNACFTGLFGGAANSGDLEISLITTGSNSVKRDFFSYENAFCWNNCTSVLTLFVAVPRYNISSTTNAVTITPGPGNNVVFDNYSMSYDPVNKQFNFQYGWNGSRFLNEKLKYLRPR